MVRFFSRVRLLPSAPSLVLFPLLRSSSSLASPLLRSFSLLLFPAPSIVLFSLIPAPSLVSSLSFSHFPARSRLELDEVGGLGARLELDEAAEALERVRVDRVAEHAVELVIAPGHRRDGSVAQ
jgi:hypothetical protein